jgi:hypothetical protein
VLFTHFFQPWNCFTPFEPIDYDDPDVVSAAANFHAAGVFWIAGSFLPSFARSSLLVPSPDPRVKLIRPDEKMRRRGPSSVLLPKWRAFRNWPSLDD